MKSDVAESLPREPRKAQNRRAYTRGAVPGTRTSRAARGWRENSGCANFLSSPRSVVVKRFASVTTSMCQSQVSLVKFLLRENLQY